MARNFAHVTITSGSAATDTITTATAHGLTAGTPVTFPSLTGGSGLTGGGGIVYFVISTGLTTTDFKVSTTSGGLARDFTTDITAGTVAWQNLQTANVSVTATPLTLSAWVKPTTLNSGASFCGVYDTAGAVNFFEVYHTSAGSVRAAARGTSFAESLATGTLGTGSWQHVVGVFASDTSRTAYLNGTAGTTNTTSITPAGLDRTAIGSRSHYLPQLFYDGLIAHVAIWNVALTGAEVGALYGGADPRTIQSSALVNYVPLTSNVDPETDTQQSYTFTVNGATYDTDNTISGRNPYVQKSRVNAAPIRAATR